nr:MAG TPA: hypothetical protein [Bacteriophage sp.]
MVSAPPVRHEPCRVYAIIEPYRRTSYRYGFFHI